MLKAIPSIVPNLVPSIATKGIRFITQTLSLSITLS